MRFGTDWATNQTLLEMTPLADAGVAEAESKVDLSALFGKDSYSCGESSYWGGQVFTRGDYAYVPRYGYSYGQNYTNAHQTLTFYVVDLSDRSAPQALGSFEVSTDSQDSYFADIVQTDGALLVGRMRGYYNYDNAGNITQRPTYSYDIYDLADPAAPKLASNFEVPENIGGYGWGRFIGGCVMDMGWGWYGGSFGNSVTLTSGDLVVSQHSEQVTGDASHVKYYLDRVDVSDPYQPRVLPAINIPGTAVHFNAGTAELVTVDYADTREAGTSYEECYARGYYANFDAATNQCVVTRRSINSLVLSGDRAVRKSQLLLDEERRTTAIAVSDSRIFYTTAPMTAFGYRGWAAPVATSAGTGSSVAQGDEEKEIATVTLESLTLSHGELTRLPSIDLRNQNSSIGIYGDLYARGDRAFAVYDSTVTVVDTRDATAPRRMTKELPGWGCQSLEVGADAAYCAAGQRGVEVIDLSSMR